MGRERAGRERRENDGTEKGGKYGSRHGWLLDAEGMVAEES